MTDIHCVTRWSKLDTTWSGVSWRDFVNTLEISFPPEANYVMAHCEQGFTTNLPLDILYDDESMFAWQYDGQPLTPDTAGPCGCSCPSDISGRAPMDPGHRVHVFKSARVLGAQRLSHER